MNKLLILLISCCFLLLGCNTAPNKPTPAEKTEPVTYIKGEFNQESLYDLMVAEIAGYRNQLPLALNNYLIQAEKTKDPAVAERATYIAQYSHNPDAALKAAHLWHSISPEHPEPYRIESEILLERQEYKQLFALTKKALKYNVFHILAIISSQAERIPPNLINKYINLITAYSRQNKSDIDAKLTLAKLYQAIGNWRQAEQAYNQALKIEPTNTVALIEKAEYLKHRQNFSQAASLIRTALKTNPDNTRLELQYIQLLLKTGKTDTAIKRCKKLLKSKTKKNDAQLINYLALVMLENNELPTSKQLLKRLLKLQPYNNSANFYLGYISQHQGDNRTAVKYYMQVTDGENLFPAILKVTNLLNQPEDKLKLQQFIQQTREQTPELSIELFIIETQWLNNQDFFDEAWETLDTGLKHYPNDPQLLYARAMLVEATNFEQTEQDLRQILMQDPNNATAQNALGYSLLSHTERYQEAYQLIDSALKNKPNEPAFIDSMGWVLFKLGKLEQALETLERAHALFPDPEVSGHLIQVYWALGQKKKAINLLRKAESKNPNNIYLEEAARIINE